MTRWMVPCNVKKYDIVKDFKKGKLVYFKRNRALVKGDEVYIYVAKPYSEIKFKGHVVQDTVHLDDVDENNKSFFEKGTTVVIIELDKQFPEGTFRVDELKRNGLGQVVNQQIICGKLEKYILGVEDSLQ